ncbi:MAG: ATP-binding protein, partial [Gemmatimonadales bacterium]
MAKRSGSGKKKKKKTTATTKKQAKSRKPAARTARGNRAKASGKVKAKSSKAAKTAAKRTGSGGAGYTAGKIQVLKGLEGVRRRPSMYIGSTSGRGLHHLVFEVVDNSIDEAMSGYCDRIDVSIQPDNSVTVVDNGRGIPVDTHPTEKVPGVELAMLTLHAGGKFDKESYKVSGGLHGVGVSVVNALSEWLEVEIHRDGQIWRQRYSRGRKETELKAGGKTEITGTKVTFKPDPEVFTELEYDFDTLATRLRELAFLNRGVKITLQDERPSKEKKSKYQYDGGIKEFVKYIRGNRKPLFSEIIYMETKRPECEIELAIQYNDGYREDTFTFVNNINTHEGGTHLTGFKAALTRTLNDYARRGGMLKKANYALTGEDVREGLTAILSVRVMDPQFEGQTKTKLGNSEVR